MKIFQRYVSTVLLVLGLAGYSSAQDVHSGIRFEPVSHTDYCYQIQVLHQDDSLAKLGTQNYRIYYDASQVRFLRERVVSLLPRGPYGEAKVIQAVHNSDASGFGNLDFSTTLGFINLSINDSGNTEELRELGNKEWVPTAEICFESLHSEPSVQLVWARKGLTDGYATAFTRVSMLYQGEVSTVEDLVHFDFFTDNSVLRHKMASSGINK